MSLFECTNDSMKWVMALPIKHEHWLGNTHRETHTYTQMVGSILCELIGCHDLLIELRLWRPRSGKKAWGIHSDIQAGQHTDTHTHTRLLSHAQWKQNKLFNKIKCKHRNLQYGISELILTGIYFVASALLSVAQGAVWRNNDVWGKLDSITYYLAWIQYLLQGCK